MSTRARKRAAGRPPARLGLETRGELLTAAIELFAEQGVGATTLTTIARRAGLTPAMVNYYFRDRDQLLDAVVEERIAPLMGYVWGSVDEAKSPGELIEGIVARIIAAIDQAPWLPPIWIRDVLNDAGALRSRVLQRLPQGHMHAASKAIARWQAEGLVNPDLDPLLLMFSTLGLTLLHLGTLALWGQTFHRRPPTRRSLRRHVTGLLLNGVHHGGASAG